MKVGPHKRVPWRDSDVKHVKISACYQSIKGNADTAERYLYLAAKRANNEDAADAIVDLHATDEWVDDVVNSLRGWVEAGRDFTFVWPTPGFCSSDASETVQHTTNALPAAVAAYLQDILGGEINDTIMQVGRPGRTRLSKLERYLYQPIFSGDVDPTTGYVLVDDTYTTGGTLAALRSYILADGGTVIGVCALSTSSVRHKRRFAITTDTVSEMFGIYGAEMRGMWIEVIGHDPGSLTEDEGRFLCSEAERRGWTAPVHDLRSCLLSLGANAIQGESDSCAHQGGA